MSQCKRQYLEKATKLKANGLSFSVGVVLFEVVVAPTEGEYAANKQVTTTDEI